MPQAPAVSASRFPRPGLSLPPAAIAVALLLLAGQTGWARGTINTRGGYYYEDCKDAVDLSLIQALARDAGDTCLVIPGQWTLTQPAVPSGNNQSTGILFSSPGSGTSFTDVLPGGAYGEKVELTGHWFSAVGDMSWINDCTTGAGRTNCFVYPINALPNEVTLGARSNQVLLAPSVAAYASCIQAGAKGCPSASRDGILVELVKPQSQFKEILVPGSMYNAVWFVRSPGTVAGAASPPNNDRLARIEIEFTGGDFFGGATAVCVEPDIALGCAKRSTGCPVRLRTTGMEGGAVTLYQNSGGIAPYTPFSASFCVGDLQSSGLAPSCFDCAGNKNPTPVGAWCDPVPSGSWNFRLNIIETCSPPTCPCGVSCKTNDSASASLYIDGLMLRAAGVRIANLGDLGILAHETGGTYDSPVFDSLSPDTLWQGIEWELDQYRDAAGVNVRTPVKLKWRFGNTANPWAGLGWTGGGGNMFHAAVPFPAVPFTNKGLPDTAPAPVALDYMGAPAEGRYFQYEATLSTWDEFLLSPPPLPPTGAGGAWAGYKSCFRYFPAHDGARSPQLKRISVIYTPAAGQLITKSIKPPKLRAWKTVTYEKSDGGGSVLVDILDDNNNVIMANVASGASLLREIDAGKYPAVRVRVTLNRDGHPAAIPKLFWLRVEYEKQEDLLTVDCNSLRLSRKDECALHVTVADSGLVEVKAHDAAGQSVKVLFRGELEGGKVYMMRWDGTDSRGARVAPGVYFITATTPSGRQTKRVAVAR